MPASSSLVEADCTLDDFVRSKPSNKMSYQIIYLNLKRCLSLYHLQIRNIIHIDLDQNY